VRGVPALPQRTVIGQRPGVVRVPTFHVHEMRLPRFGYSPPQWTARCSSRPRSSTSPSSTREVNEGYKQALRARGA
jgi:hypothetical protein